MIDLPYEEGVPLLAIPPSEYFECGDVKKLTFPRIAQAMPTLGPQKKSVAFAPGGFSQVRDEIAGFIKIPPFIVSLVAKLSLKEPVVLDAVSLGDDREVWTIYDAYFPEQPDLSFTQRFPKAREMFSFTKSFVFMKSKVIPDATKVEVAKKELATEIGTMYGLPILILKPHPEPFKLEPVERFPYLNY